MASDEIKKDIKASVEASQEAAKAAADASDLFIRHNAPGYPQTTPKLQQGAGVISGGHDAQVLVKLSELVALQRNAVMMAQQMVHNSTPSVQETRANLAQASLASSTTSTSGRPVTPTIVATPSAARMPLQIDITKQIDAAMQQVIKRRDDAYTAFFRSAAKQRSAESVIFPHEVEKLSGLSPSDARFLADQYKNKKVIAHNPQQDTLIRQALREASAPTEGRYKQVPLTGKELAKQYQKFLNDNNSSRDNQLEQLRSWDAGVFVPSKGTDRTTAYELDQFHKLLATKLGRGQQTIPRSTGTVLRRMMGGTRLIPGGVAQTRSEGYVYAEDPLTPGSQATVQQIIRTANDITKLDPDEARALAAQLKGDGAMLGLENLPGGATGPLAKHIENLRRRAKAYGLAGRVPAQSGRKTYQGTVSIPIEELASVTGRQYGFRAAARTAMGYLDRIPDPRVLQATTDDAAMADRFAGRPLSPAKMGFLQSETAQQILDEGTASTYKSIDELLANSDLSPTSSMNEVRAAVSQARTLAKKGIKDTIARLNEASGFGAKDSAEPGFTARDLRGEAYIPGNKGLRASLKDLQEKVKAAQSGGLDADAPERTDYAAYKEWMAHFQRSQDTVEGLLARRNATAVARRAYAGISDEDTRWETVPTSVHRGSGRDITASSLVSSTDQEAIDTAVRLRVLNRLQEGGDVPASVEGNFGTIMHKMLEQRRIAAGKLSEVLVSGTTGGLNVGATLDAPNVSFADGKFRIGLDDYKSSYRGSQDPAQLALGFKLLRETAFKQLPAELQSFVTKSLGQTPAPDSQPLLDAQLGPMRFITPDQELRKRLVSSYGAGLPISRADTEELLASVERAGTPISTVGTGGIGAGTLTGHVTDVTKRVSELLTNIDDVVVASHGLAKLGDEQFQNLNISGTDSAALERTTSFRGQLAAIKALQLGEGVLPPSANGLTYDLSEEKAREVLNQLGFAPTVKSSFDTVSNTNTTSVAPRGALQIMADLKAAYLDKRKGGAGETEILRLQREWTQFVAKSGVVKGILGEGGTTPEEVRKLAEAAIRPTRLDESIGKIGYAGNIFTTAIAASQARANTVPRVPGSQELYNTMAQVAALTQTKEAFGHLGAYTAKGRTGSMEWLTEEQVREALVKSGGVSDVTSMAPHLVARKVLAQMRTEQRPPEQIADVEHMLQQMGGEEALGNYRQRSDKQDFALSIEAAMKKLYGDKGQNLDNPEWQAALKAAHDRAAADPVGTINYGLALESLIPGNVDQTIAAAAVAGSGELQVPAAVAARFKNNPRPSRSWSVLRAKAGLTRRGSRTSTEEISPDEKMAWISYFGGGGGGDWNNFGGGGGFGGPPGGPGGPGGPEGPEGRIGVNYNLRQQEGLRRFLSDITGHVNKAYGLESSERISQLTKLSTMANPAAKELSAQATASLTATLSAQMANYGEMATVLSKQTDKGLTDVFGRGFNIPLARDFQTKVQKWYDFSSDISTVQEHMGEQDTIRGITKRKADMSPDQLAAFERAQARLKAGTHAPNLITPEGHIDNREMEKALALTKEMQTQARQAGVNFTGASTDAITGGNQESRHLGFVERFRLQITKLWAYMAGGMVVYSIIGYVQKLSAELMNLASATARIQGVLGGKTLTERMELKRDIIAQAKEYGSTIGEVANSLQVFVQAGFSKDKAFAATRATLQAEKGAGIAPGQATEFLIASNALYKGEAVFGHLIDKLSRVEMTRAISAQDLAVIQQRAGSIASELQPDQVGRIKFDDILAGAGTALVEQTRVTGEVAATSLRFMMSRLASPRVVNALQQRYGVQLGGADPKEYAPLSDMLQRLAAKYESLKGTAAGTTFLATFAGARQINAAAALFDRINDVMDVAGDATSAFGETMRRVNTQMDTFPAQLQRLNVSLTAMASALGGNGLLGKLAVWATGGLANGITAASQSGFSRLGAGAVLAVAAGGIASFRNRREALATLTPKAPDSFWNSGTVGTTIGKLGKFGGVTAGIATTAAATIGGTLMITALLELFSWLAEQFMKWKDSAKSYIDSATLRKDEFFKSYQDLATSLDLVPATLSEAVNAASKKAIFETEKALGMKHDGSLVRGINQGTIKEPAFRQTFTTQVVEAFMRDTGKLGEYFANLPKEDRGGEAMRLMADTNTLLGYPESALTAHIEDAMLPLKQPLLRAVSEWRRPIDMANNYNAPDTSPWAALFGNMGPGLSALTQKIESTAKALGQGEDAITDWQVAVSIAANDALAINTKAGSPDRLALDAYNRRNKTAYTFYDFGDATHPRGAQEEGLRDRAANRAMFREAIARNIYQKSPELQAQADAAGVVWDNAMGKSSGSFSALIAGIFDESKRELQAKLDKGGLTAAVRKHLTSLLRATEQEASNAATYVENAQKRGGTLQLRNRLVNMLSASAAEQTNNAAMSEFYTQRGWGQQDQFTERRFNAAQQLVNGLISLPSDIARELANLEASPQRIEEILNSTLSEGSGEPSQTIGGRIGIRGTPQQQLLDVSANIEILSKMRDMIAPGGSLANVITPLSAPTQEFLFSRQTLRSGKVMDRGLTGLTKDDIKNLTPEELTEIWLKTAGTMDLLINSSADFRDALLKDVLAPIVKLNAVHFQLETGFAARRASSQLAIQQASGQATYAQGFGRDTEYQARVLTIQADQASKLDEIAMQWEAFQALKPNMIASQGDQAVLKEEEALRGRLDLERLKTNTDAATAVKAAEFDAKLQELLAKRDRTTAAGSGLRDMLGNYQNLAKAVKEGTVFQQAFQPVADQITGGTADLFVSSLVGPQGIFKNLFSSLTDPIYEGARTGTMEGVLDAFGKMSGTGGSGAMPTTPAELIASYGGAAGAASPILGALGAAGGTAMSNSPLGALLGLGGAFLGSGLYLPKATKQLGPGGKATNAILTSKQLALNNLKENGPRLVGQLGGAAVGGGGTGSQVGSALGSMGGQLAAQALVEGGPAVIGGVLGSAIPIVGTIIGGLLGGLLGGLFDKKPDPPKPDIQAFEKIERNTRDTVTALQNQVDLMTLDDRLLNVPATFVVPDYRPLTVGNGTAGMTGPTSISIVINDARDPDAVAKAVSTELSRSMRSSGLYVPTR